MKAKFYLSLLFALCLVVNSCNEAEDADVSPIREDPPVPTDFPTVPVSIELPAGSSIDLDKAALVGGFKDFPVSSNLSSKVFLPAGRSQLTFLMDKSDRIILMGFINEENKTLSTHTTAEALLYLAAGVFMLPDIVKTRFHADASSLPGMDDFKKSIETLFKNDPLMLEKGTYMTALKDYLESIDKPSQAIDVRARQINLDPTGVKSGIQLVDKDFQSILFNNSYRRRAHAFVYKQSFKTKDGDETVLIRSFNSESSHPIAGQTAIDPVGEADGIIGVLLDQIKGNGIETFVKESGPVTIPLEENESEAKFAVRVVGAAFQNNYRQNMSAIENEKYDALVLETFIKDVLLPVLAEIINQKADKSAGDDEAMKEIFNGFTSAFTSEFPEIYDKIKEGKFSEALRETLQKLLINGIANTAMSNATNQLLRYIYLKNVKEPEFGNLYSEPEFEAKKNAAKFLKAFELINRGLQLWEASRLLTHLASSQALEEFTARAIQHDVKLRPKSSAVMVFRERELTAYTVTELSEGQTFEYRWSTSGKYGKIKDKQGNEGSSITNEQKTVSYISEEISSKLPENASDRVMVEIYVKQGSSYSLIGKDTATINIKKQELVIAPGGVTLSGKEKQRLRLYVEWADGSPFHDPAFYDYRYEWSTPGRYGMLEGSLTSKNTTQPFIVYQALDEDVEEGEEKLLVEIHRIRKDGGEWHKYDIAEGKVKVNNDDNYKIIHVPFTPITYLRTPKPYTAQGGSKGISVGYSVWHTAVFAREDDHESYVVKTYGFKRQLGWLFTTFSWSANGTHANLLGQYINGSDTWEGSFPEDQIGVFITRAFLDCNQCDFGDRLANTISQYNSFGGMAEIKIKLKK
ncbi:MAG: hypothetical protein JJU28_15630 [Cyclobacteriaceae bacterium]|nr:hypothetical protein [Cyclobacteriaceae bacterium]